MTSLRSPAYRRKHASRILNEDAVGPVMRRRCRCVSNETVTEELIILCVAS